MVAAFVRDLTLRNRLKESSERLAAVVASAGVIVLACETNGRITLAEGSGLSTFNLTMADAVGRNLRQLLNWHADSMAEVEHILAGKTSGGRLHVDRPEAYLGFVASPILGDGGAITGISVVLSDSTARVRAEVAQRESEAKSRLMAMMNHEVRTPLNSILGFAHLMDDPQSGELNEKQRRYVSN
ncbi:MAG: hypothetical protein E6I89_16925, partial [Chloroflexi bacterium]